MSKISYQRIIDNEEKYRRKVMSHIQKTITLGKEKATFIQIKKQKIILTFLQARTLKNGRMKYFQTSMKLKPIVIREKVLNNPEEYIGCMKEIEENHWIMQDNRMIYKQLKYTPALLKLYQDLLINAAQNIIKKDKNTTIIQVTIRQDGFISISNDGDISLIDKIDDQNYLLQCIFGNSNSHKINYQMGYSAKFVNIFSKHFVVQTGSQKQKIAVKIQWRNNMQHMEEPTKMNYNKKDYFKVSYQIDFTKFNIQKYSPDFICLMERRAHDIAGLLRVKCIINSKTVSYDNFLTYAQRFVKEPSQLFSDSSEMSPRWKVIIAKTQYNKFQQVSFVNGCIWTKNGGNHVNYVICQIANRGLELYQKRMIDSLDAYHKPDKYKSNYFIMVSIYLQEPKYNSPTRETLLNPINFFGSLYNLSDRGLQFLKKNNLLKIFQEMAQQRDANKLNQSLLCNTQNFKRNKSNQSKDCNISSKCLIVVQSQSLKSTIFKCLEEGNKQDFDIFTLKEKFVNTRNANTNQIMNNQDIWKFIKTIGLSFNRVYTSVKDLKYRSILIMANQYTEGTLLRGLILNFLETFWPSLCKIKGFITFFYPPVVKCIHPNGAVKQFKNKNEYQNWSTTSNSPSQWTVQFNEKLNQMSEQSMKQLLLTHQKWTYSVIYRNQDDNKALKLVYSKNNTDHLKKWLENNKMQFDVIYNSRNITVTNFVNKQLSNVFALQNSRYVPSVIDGLKLIQRKILHCMLQCQNERTISVTKLAANVMQIVNYNISVNEIQSNIIKMAQSYVGSNNLPILKSVGHFGTRMKNGKDSDSVEYLSVGLAHMTRLLFPQDDEQGLSYVSQDGVNLQPKYYVPILPLMLINGCNSNGSLWNTVVYGRRVDQIIEMVKNRINEKIIIKAPSWEGFQGIVYEQKKGNYKVSGKLQIKNHNIFIKEVPITKSIKQFKESLQAHVHNTQRQGELEYFQQGFYPDSDFLFMLKFQEGKQPQQGELQKYLQLSEKIKEINMTLINQKGKFKGYKTVFDIFEEYFKARIQLYKKRKLYLISKFTRSIEELTEKIRFLKDILNLQFILTESKEEWRKKFIEKNYKRWENFSPIAPTKKIQLQPQLNDYQHLYKIQIRQLSEENINQLIYKQNQQEEALVSLERLSQKQLWLKDISIFQQHWKQTAKRLLQQQPFQRISQQLLQKSAQNLSIIHKIGQQESDISLNSQQRAELERSVSQNQSQYRLHRQNNIKNDMSIYNNQLSFNKKQKLQEKIIQTNNNSASIKQEVDNKIEQSQLTTKKEKDILQKIRLQSLKKLKSNQHKIERLKQQDYEDKQTKKDKIQTFENNFWSHQGQKRRKKLRKQFRSGDNKMGTNFQITPKKDQEKIPMDHLLEQPACQYPQITVPYQYKDMFSVNQIQGKNSAAHLKKYEKQRGSSKMTANKSKANKSKIVRDQDEE